VSPERYERARKRVLWLMAHAGYIGKSVAGLGSEPPPEIDPMEDEPIEPEPGAGEREGTLPAGPSPSGAPSEGPPSPPAER
jgi:hypothetical protein